jgi:hypothetical protein
MWDSPRNFVSNTKYCLIRYRNWSSWPGFMVDMSITERNQLLDRKMRRQYPALRSASAFRLYNPGLP